jgi:hypothetical protein
MNCHLILGVSLILMYLSKFLRHIFLDRPNSISLVLRFNIIILVLRILIVLSIVVKRI